MAVVRVRRIFEDDGGAAIGNDGDATVKERRVYMVVFDGVGTAAEAYQASDGVTTVPFLNSIDGLLRCRDKQVRRDPENPNIWLVTTAWESDAAANERTPGDKWNVNIEVDGWEYTQPVPNNVVTNKPIANSAGVPFSPQKTESYALEQITLTWRTNEVDWEAMNDAREKVNADFVSFELDGFSRSFGERELWLAKAGARGVITDGVFQHWEVTLVMVHDPAGWKLRTLDQGLHELIGGELVPITDKHGDPITTPVPLNGSGRRLSVGADAVILEDDSKEEAAFTPLFVGLEFTTTPKFTTLSLGL